MIHAARLSLVFVACLLALPAPASAQRYKPRTGHDNDRDNGDRENVKRGRASGRILSLTGRGANNAGDATFGIVVQGDKGRRWTLAVGPKSELQVTNASAVSGRQARVFLVPGVQVDADWVLTRFTDRGGATANLAERIVIRAEAIEGVITRMNAEHLTVSATPKGRPADADDDDALVAAGGRRAAKPKAGKASDPIKPKTVKLVLLKEVSEITLDGKDATAAEVLAAWKAAKQLRFEAVVVGGGANPIVELHARRADAEAGPKDPRDAKRNGGVKEKGR